MLAARPRRYGRAPYRVALLAGGPGAPGELRPLAKRLARDHGVLEALQTETTLAGQIAELRDELEATLELPATVVGHSGGGILGYLFAAHYPELVRKLILVSSGPFDEEHAAEVLMTRLDRLGPRRGEAEQLLARLTGKEDAQALRRLGRIFARVDAFDPLPAEAKLQVQPEAFSGVWPEVRRMRRSGELLSVGKLIRCPVVAIHGSYDPHPLEGVEILETVLDDFRLVRLERCGHTPWLERQAKDAFFSALEEELLWEAVDRLTRLRR
jgi:pimeloyl-ACP methyl ester carboxylesterase